MIEQALTGLKVVEWGNFVSAPFAAKMLADLGAEVIKVEEPLHGDEARQHGPFPNNIPHPERSGLFLSLNTNKLGITLNLKTHSGQSIFKELLKESDVLVENNPPRVTQDLGLNYDRLKEVNASLIVTSITPYGQTGPNRDYKGYAINCDAAGGVSFGMGSPGREPLAYPLSIADKVTGVAAAVATLVALFGRDAIGRGQLVDVSETDLLATIFTGMIIPTYIYLGISGDRGGYRARTGQYPFTFLPCKDGTMMLYTPQIEQWTRFLEVMGNPEWTKDPRYRNRRAMAEEYPDEADNLLRSWLMARTKQEIFEATQSKRVPFAPVKRIDEVMNDSHLKERGYFVEVQDVETGTLKYPGAPYKFSEAPWMLKRRAPRLGEHNEEVYCGRLGYSKEELTQLRRGGII